MKGFTKGHWGVFSVMKRHFDDPPIEVLSCAARLPALHTRLGRARMRPSRAMVPLRLDYAAPLLIDMASDPDPTWLKDFLPSWYDANQPRLLVILGHPPEGLHPRDAIHLPETDDLLTLRDRLAIRQREVLRELESKRRSETAERLGAPSLSVPHARYTHRLLYLGNSGPHFGPLKAALAGLGGEMAAALSPTMALDYLAQHRFSAVLLGDTGTSGLDGFLSPVAPDQTRSAPALIHLQAARSAAQPLPLPADKLDLILPLDMPSDTLARRIMAFLPRPAPPLSPPAHDDAQITDGSTGLFSLAFLRAHLTSLIAVSSRTGQPLSVLHLRASTETLDLTRLARTVRLSLREYDLAAPLDPNTLCIVMPDTPYRSGLSVARRLEGLCDGALVWHLMERRRSQDADALLDPWSGRSRPGSARQTA